MEFFTTVSLQFTSFIGLIYTQTNVLQRSIVHWLAKICCFFFFISCPIESSRNYIIICQIWRNMHATWLNFMKSFVRFESGTQKKTIFGVRTRNYPSLSLSFSREFDFRILILSSYLSFMDFLGWFLLMLLVCNSYCAIHWVNIECSNSDVILSISSNSFSTSRIGWYFAWIWFALKLWIFILFWIQSLAFTKPASLMILFMCMTCI